MMMDVCPKDVRVMVVSFVCGRVDCEMGVVLDRFSSEAKGLRCTNKSFERLVSEHLRWLQVKNPCGAGRVASLALSFPNLRSVHVEVGTPVEDKELFELSGIEVSVRAWPWIAPRNPLLHPLFGADRSLNCLCALDLSGAMTLDDASVSSIFEVSQCLKELRLRNCPSLCEPRFFKAAQSLRLLEVDASYGLNLTTLLNFAQARKDLVVDIFEDNLLQDDVVEVVILSGIHKGQWVTATVLKQHSLHRYDVLVHPTPLYDRAVGYAGRSARRVRRTHLRIPNYRASKPLLFRQTPKPQTATHYLRHLYDDRAKLIRMLTENAKKTFDDDDFLKPLPSLSLWPPDGAHLAFDHWGNTHPSPALA